MSASINSATLILVGTVHHDPHGYDTLMSLFTAITPGLITLEFSSYGRGFRTKNNARLSRRIHALISELTEGELRSADAPSRKKSFDDLPPSIQHLLKTIDYPFEYRAAEDYAAAHKIPCYCIDISGISRRRLTALKQEAMARANITFLLNHAGADLPASVAQSYKRACVLFNDHASVVPFSAADTAASEHDRDVHMSRRIINLGARHPRKVLVHVGGWEHIAAEGCENNLYYLLKDYAPQRILLDEHCLVDIESRRSTPAAPAQQY